MIILRLDKNGGINKGDIKAFEHDNKSETYIIQLYKNNKVYDLTNKTVELTIVEKKRKYGDVVTLPVEAAAEGKVKLEIVAALTKQDGTYDFKLTVKDTAGLIETFPNFQVKIDTDITKNIAGEIAEDKNFTIITEGLKALGEYEVYKTNAKKVPDIEKNVANLGSQLDNKANKYKSEIIGIKGWRQPNQDKKIVFVGDSTTDSALSIYSEIKKYYINSGDCLSGINESNLINKGANGNTIANFINNIPSGKGINDVIALKPDLIIFCYGINDVRLGNTTLERLIELHDNAITRLLKETNAYILLRTPHPLCSDSPNGFIQPSDAGQQYTDILWECYEHFRGKYPKTDVLDLQTLVFGRVSKNVADSPLMADELHANNIGQAREGSVIADFIGEKPKKDSYKARNSISYTDYPKLLEDNPLYEKICEAYFMNMGNNYLDIYLPKDKISLIQKGDILKIGDELACEFTGTTSVNGNYVRILNTFTNYDKNKKGMVEVYRVKKNKENIGFGANSISTNGVFDQFYCFNKNIVITNFIIKSNFPIPNGATFTLSSTHNGTKTDICDITFTHNNMNGSFVWLNNITSKIVETYDFLTLTCKSITYTGQVRISIILE